MSAYTLYTDDQLLALLRNADEGAFTELYDRYWKKLLIRANLLLNSYADAEETVHDIFVAIWQKRGTLVIRNTFHTYIAAMLQYSCFKRLAENRRKTIITDSAGFHEISDHSTTEWLDFEHLQEDLERAVSALPEKCQLVFRLSREQGLTDQQIADQLEVSVNTVRTQMHRALTRLKTSLNNFFLL